MKIKSIFFFMLFFGNTIFYGQQSEDDLDTLLIDNIMIIWTKIDIVRAINTNTSQKNMFLDDIINDSLNAYCLSRQLKKVSEGSAHCNNEDIVNLLLLVQGSFQDVFDQVNNTDLNVLGFVLKKIVELLKVPEKIQPDIAT